MESHNRKSPVYRIFPNSPKLLLLTQIVHDLVSEKFHHIIPSNKNITDPLI